MEGSIASASTKVTNIELELWQELIGTTMAEDQNNLQAGAAPEGAATDEGPQFGLQRIYLKD